LAPGFQPWWAALKRTIKARLARLRVWHAQRFRAYGRPELLSALRELGVHPGDAVMLHSAFSAQHGFRGSVDDLIDTLVEAVGPEGHLLMVSLPYRNAALDWLESGRRFDVRKTPSMMGLVSEMFRRRPDVRRSLHPTHPILVRGPRAAEFIAEHPRCVHPCGPGTPFDQLARADGLAVFLNVPIDMFTFFHYLEHLVSPGLPFALYTERVFDAPVIDAEGQPGIVRTHAFAREAIRRRRPERLYDALREGGFVASRRVGATQLLAVRVRDAIDCTHALQAQGRLFYDMTP
jgi:aminoglycoside 3-N-acetyltransferase